MWTINIWAINRYLLYVRYVEIVNKVARLNDYSDASEMWLKSYAGGGF